MTSGTRSQEQTQRQPESPDPTVGRPLGHKLVLVLPGAEDSALGRFFASMGAEVQVVGLPDLQSRLAGASFLLDPLGSGRLADAGWPRERIESVNPGLIHVSVTCFGSDGPRAGWRGSELIASAMGGVLRLTGQPDREPVKEALDACFFHADMVAAAGAMAAHFERGATGKGQHVDVSAQEVAFSRNVNSILVWQFDRRKLQRVGGALNYGRATVRCIWPLADGWCFHTLMSGRFGAPANRALSDWIDECGLNNPLRGTDWLKYNRSTVPADTRRLWEDAIGQFFVTRTKREIATEGRRRGINATVVCTPDDVLADEHLRAREFWSEREGARSTLLEPGSGRLALRVPGRFLRMVPGELLSGRSVGTAVRDGVPSGVVSGAGGGLDRDMRRGAGGAEGGGGAATRPGPLAGVKVLDFSWALVGSITTKVLGDLGAEVVKVESRTRPCLSRIDVQVSVSQAGSFDDKPWFAHLNSSKKSLSLDMKKPESREVLEPLLAWADVVVENFSPGTMAKLGLDFETLRRKYPGIIMVSGSVYGQTGPLSQEWGVDGTGAALSGRTYLTGWADRDPVIPGAVPYGDVIVPYAMAAGTAAALQHRRETGYGCHIDAAMYEICVQQTYDAIVAAQSAPAGADSHVDTPTASVAQSADVDASVPARIPMRPATIRQGDGDGAAAAVRADCRTGNADARVYLQGAYPVAGPDCWIALSFITREDWVRFLAYAQLMDGQTHSEREELIRGWTRGQEGGALCSRLQDAGFAAGVVQDIEDLLEHDPQLRFREALTMLDHPMLGAFGHVRSPITFSRSTIAPFRPPAMGEHSVQIARTIAGLTPERIDDLRMIGVFE